MEKVVSVSNNRGEKLVGLYERRSQRRLVMALHGLNATKNHEPIRRAVRMLASQGFSTLRFDFSGSGESEGNEVFSIAQQVKDIAAWVTMFHDYPSITLLGGSFSAWPAAIAAAKIPQVTGLVAINGFYGKLPPKMRILRFMYYGVKLIAGWFKPWKWEVDYAYKAFKPERIKVPVLVAYTPSDEIVDYRESVEFYRELQTKKQLAVIENTNHEVTNRSISRRLLEQFVVWHRQCEVEGVMARNT